jgi:predicted nucleotidyltransferase
MRRATILRVLGGRWFEVSLQLAVKRLLEYDPDIVEVVQFGSSVYAPELSRDVDLLVITKRAREYRGYLDAVSPLEADVIVVEVGEAVGGSLLRGFSAPSKSCTGMGAT